MTTPANALNLLKEKEAKFVDLRFTDTRGKEQHLTIPAHTVDASFFEDGKMFDGSSIAGWKGIQESDMVLMPDASTLVVDPFTEDTTLNLRCDVYEPSTMQGYARCPRMTAKRAEAYLKSTGIADQAFFGPENEFFIFDDVRYGADMNGSFYQIDSDEGAWNYTQGIRGRQYRPSSRHQGRLLPRTAGRLTAGHPLRDVPRRSKRWASRSKCTTTRSPPRGQGEIGVKFGSLVQKGDQVQILKYVVQNVAHAFGKTATFMPKPLVGDNGSGMHVHQSLAKDGKNLFTGDVYGGLSQTALYYIGGILKHAHAINALTNPSTNSYKRLVPGFEAPVMLAYSARNRSASIRIPFIANPKGRRIEVRFPDSTANPYFAFSAMLMAGLDGIQNKINPGDAMDKDLYDLEPEEDKKIPKVCFSLEQALEALDKDRDFLKAGNVFSDDLIDAYISLKYADMTRVRMATHPLEFQLYYSL